jgi:hypothetical protein
MARLGEITVEHAPTSDLALFIRGRLPSARANLVCEHVLACDECQEEVHVLAELLWPSLSIWIKLWLRIFSPSWPPSRVLRFMGGSFQYFRRSARARFRTIGQRASGI